MIALTDRQLDDELWLRPMDVGGRDGSHHGRTLSQLVRKGLAEESRGNFPRGTARHGFRYRRTLAGRTAVYGARPIDRLGHANGSE